MGPIIDTGMGVEALPGPDGRIQYQTPQGWHADRPADRDEAETFYLPFAHMY